MQFLSIESVSKLVDLSNLVGDRNVESILVVNGLSRTVNIKDEYTQLCDSARLGDQITGQRKKTILNKFTQDSDIFEAACLLSENDWKVLNTLNTLPNYLYIPETIELASSADILGNGVPVKNTIYNAVMEMLGLDPPIIDPGIFNEYSVIKNTKISDSNISTNPPYWFPIPLGAVTLYSSLSDSSIDFPAYPEEVPDSTKANYTQMPNLLYQYEPWYIYESSGPRSNSYKFDLHRDMWSGNHNDGKANELIRFCQSCCYPRYEGSAVYSDIVTLYVNGYALIRGIMEDYSVNWDGPLLDDGWYAHFTLEFTITEISDIELNNDTVRSKPLIG